MEVHSVTCISPREWRDWVVTADWTLKLLYSLEGFAAGWERGRVRECGWSLHVCHRF